MTGMATLEQIQRMPKLELHIHLEGTFDPETVCLLAEMQGISLPRPRQHLFDFSGLSDFLDLLDWICSLVQNRETAQQIAYRHAKYAQEQGILYTEIIVNPSHWKNIRTGELLTGVLEGFDQAGADGLNRSWRAGSGGLETAGTAPERADSFEYLLYVECGRRPLYAWQSSVG